MAKHGQLEAIVTHQDQIVDGRNRFRACVSLGLTPKFEAWSGQGGSLINFIVARNLHRRHLTAGQRAMLGVVIKKEIEKEGKERMSKAGSKGGKTSGRGRKKAKKQTASGNGQHNDDRGFPILENPYEPANDEPHDEPFNATKTAAEMVGVSTSYVADAVLIQEQAPELAEQVKQGSVSLPTAKRQVTTKKSPSPKKTKPQIDQVEKTFKSITKKFEGKELDRLVRKLADYCGFLIKQAYEA